MSASEGEQYTTYFNIDRIAAVYSPDDRERDGEGLCVGLLVEPMDLAPFVIELGPMDALRALGEYLIEMADSERVPD